LCAAGAAPTIFGSVALPLDSKHTQGAQIPMPIFDEGLNMKGVVRVAAQWSSSYPRRVKVVLNGLQGLPEDGPATEVACRFSTSSGKSVVGPKVGLACGFADFSHTVVDTLELLDEADKLTLEVILFGPDGAPALFGKADATLPGDAPKEESVNIAGPSGARAQVHINTAWLPDSG